MKKILSSIKTWLQAERAAMAERRHAHHVEAIKEEALARIQVREFEGGLYICFDNKPLLNDQYLQGRAEGIVSQVRKNYERYKLSNYETRSKQF